MIRRLIHRILLGVLLLLVLWSLGGCRLTMAASELSVEIAIDESGYLPTFDPYEKNDNPKLNSNP